MRWPTREATRQQLIEKLDNHSSLHRHLPGLEDRRATEALATQVIASLRREDYYRAVQRKAVLGTRADPNHATFDAERAVAYHTQHANVDEAAWLIFLMTHFARSADTGWLRLRDVYGKLGAGIWNWEAASESPEAFAAWLTANWEQVRGKFGNHRKYESLRPGSVRNTSRVVADYVRWIGGRGHAAFISDGIARSGNDAFDLFYREMPVTSFGRLAKFDYLMLISRYGIANMAPGSAYLEGATGPRSGAALLFTGLRESSIPAATLQEMLDTLDADLGLGMAVLEDALCNWQKQPYEFVHFKG